MHDQRPDAGKDNTGQQNIERQRRTGAPDLVFQQDQQASQAHTDQEGSFHLQTLSDKVAMPSLDRSVSL